MLFGDFQYVLQKLQGKWYDLNKLITELKIFNENGHSVSLLLSAAHSPSLPYKIWDKMPGFSTLLSTCEEYRIVPIDLLKHPRINVYKVS